MCVFVCITAHHYLAEKLFIVAVKPSLTRGVMENLCINEQARAHLKFHYSHQSCYFFRETAKISPHFFIYKMLGKKCFITYNKAIFKERPRHSFPFSRILPVSNPDVLDLFIKSIIGRMPKR